MVSMKPAACLERAPIERPARHKARLTATKLLQLEGTSAYPATHRPLSGHPRSRVLPKFGPQCGAKTRGEAGRLTVMECEQRQAIERYKQDMENSVLRLGSLSEEGRIFSKLNAQCADRLEAHKKDCPICKAS